MPEASAATNAGEVAVPVACAKNARRGRTTKAPSTPPITARSVSSSSAVRKKGSSTRSTGEGSPLIAEKRNRESFSFTFWGKQAGNLALRCRRATGKGRAAASPARRMELSYRKGLIAAVAALVALFTSAFAAIVLLGGSVSFREWPTPPRGGESKARAPQELRRVSPSELADLAAARPVGPDRGNASRSGSGAGGQ